MSRIVSQKTTRLELSNGEWVDVREQLSYAELEPIFVALDTKNDVANAKMAIPLFQLAIINWLMKDDEGTEIPFDKEKIKMFDTGTTTELLPRIINLYFPQKKSSEISGA